MNMEIFLRWGKGVCWDLGCFPEALLPLEPSLEQRVLQEVMSEAAPGARSHAGPWSQHSAGPGAQGRAGAAL